MAKIATLELEQVPTQARRIADIEQALYLWKQVRAGVGLKPNDAAIVTTTGNAKLDAQMAKGDRRMFANHTLLAGEDEGTCTNTKACGFICIVNRGGRYAMGEVMKARRARTVLALQYPEAHAAILLRDIHKAGRRAKRKRMALRLRLNTNSDMAWEKLLPDEIWEAVGMYGLAYDYTKRRDRVGWLNPVYKTAYSCVSWTKVRTIDNLLDQGKTPVFVLPVPKGDPIPATWGKYELIDGDSDDDRSGDVEGKVVALTAKGKLLANWKKDGVWGPLAVRPSEFYV